jgi:tripeptidyl-peptidase-1
LGINSDATQQQPDFGWRSYCTYIQSPRDCEIQMTLTMACVCLDLFRILAIVMVLTGCAVWGRRIEANLNMRHDLTKDARSDSSKMHEVVFVVKSRNMESLKMTLYDISDIKSPNYGKHLTRAQLSELTANPEGNAILTRSLSAYPELSVVKRSRDNRFITVIAPLSVWEKLFSAEFYSFFRTNRFGEVDLVLDRAMSYEVPAPLSEHLDAVLNTVQMPGISRNGLQRENIKSEGYPAPQPIMSGAVTPQLLRSFYEISSNNVQHLGSQSVYESDNQNFSPDDLRDFQLHFSLAVNAVSMSVNGHNSSSECVAVDDHHPIGNCTEANLDVQYIMATGQNVSTVYFYDNSPYDEFMVEWAQELLNMDHPPLINSVSYGGYESTVAPEYLESFEDSVIKLGSLGVTIFASSGDDGVAGYGLRTGNISYCGYHPQWPASSPHVTAVGGTQGPESDLSEVACTSNGGGVITSGGGFSNVFGLPSWQNDAVAGGYFSEIFTIGEEPATGYNTSGRGYPDISAMAYNYYFLEGDQWLLVSGTVNETSHDFVRAN